jgi:hypothetical protein
VAEPAVPEVTSEDATPPKTRRARRVLASGVGIVLGLVLLVAVMRVFIPTIPPEQEAPEPHVGEPCVLCHFVFDGAEEIEVE